MIARFALASALFACSQAQAQTASPVLIAPRTISLDAAHQLAKATLDACRKNGFNVTVTVLDRNGRTRIVLHDDNANPHTIENARRKAYTSLTFRVNTMEYGKRFTGENRPPMLDGITTAAGGMLIKAGNDVVGSVGVSGAPGGDKDQACAEVGLLTISAGLN